MAEQAPTSAFMRRGFRFGLRGMFVAVTVIGCWLGWELRFVQKRKAMRQWGAETQLMIRVSQKVPANSVPGYNPPRYNDPVRPEYKVPAIPFWRRWLGDEVIGYLLLSERCTKRDVQRAQDLFPEATIQTGNFLISRPQGRPASATLEQGNPKPRRFDGFKM